MTSRALRTDLENALDYLTEAELVLYPNRVASTETSVGWHAHDPGRMFLISHGHTTIEQYLAWVTAGAYTAVLRDGSLLQIAYSVDQSTVVGHRLAYVPCPVEVDENLLLEEALSDVVDLQLLGGHQTISMKSPVRFEYDPSAAKAGHPAAHFSLNGPDCRIACIAPVHPYRFLDFVFRHFYPIYRAAHEGWFGDAAVRQLGQRVISADDRDGVHLSWSVT